MPGNLCEHCTAVCCHYIALPIDEPESKSDFDDLRWYLLHENVSVFIEDDEWHLHVATPCRHLQPDYRCGIYETRPRICRAYTTENCDYHSGDYGWEEHFNCPEDLDEYLRRERLEERLPAETGTREKRRRRAGIRMKLSRQRQGRAAQAPTDVRGLPLPILEVRR